MKYLVLKDRVLSYYDKPEDRRVKGSFNFDIVGAKADLGGCKLR